MLQCKLTFQINFTKISLLASAYEYDRYCLGHV